MKTMKLSGISFLNKEDLKKLKAAKLYALLVLQQVLAVELVLILWEMLEYAELVQVQLMIVSV